MSGSEMLTESAAYRRVRGQAKKIAQLKSSIALLEWDQQTQMPAAAGSYRADQLGVLTGALHRQETDAGYGDDLQTAAAELDPTSSDDAIARAAADARELLRRFKRKTCLSETLVEHLARANALGQQQWLAARQQDDFGVFQSSLQTILDLKREEADAYDQPGNKYDALLDEYEPGLTSPEVNAVLQRLRDELVPLIEQVKGSSTQIDDAILRRCYPVPAQQQLTHQVAEAIGFDFTRGRIDSTEHPFCTTLGPHDIRITTRFYSNQFGPAFFGTMHEAGHGIYEQGLEPEDFGLPTGEYCSLGIHESQSRLWENLVGRSEPFWDWMYAPVCDVFQGVLHPHEAREFWLAINKISPSLIRVEADEATYNLHIIIRFELEQALISGDLQVADLPLAWADKYQQTLGLRPASAVEGVLQDVHWSCGLFGYFPTYTLGNIAASQIYAAAEAELGNLGTLFRNGDFGQLKGWLNQNIHQHGARFSSAELLSRVCNSQLDPAPLINHLRQKCSKIYQLSG